MNIEVQKLSKEAIDPVECDDCSYYILAKSGDRIDPFERKAITTDLQFAMPEGVVAHVVPILELYYHKGLYVLETIYSSKEPIMLCLMNMSLPDQLYVTDKSALTASYYFGSMNSFHFNRGDRLAKIIFHKTEKIKHD
jgi:dUTPase